MSNPELLKEGTAIADFMKPDRVVIGSDSKRALDVMREVYEPFLRTFNPLITMDTRSAEMTKYAANCFLATKISFINEISTCEKAGADISAVREAIGAERRIRYEFLFPGVGYGGSCLPKDARALIHTAENVGSDMRALRAVDEVNSGQKAALVSKIVAHFGGRQRTATNLDSLRFGSGASVSSPRPRGHRGCRRAARRHRVETVPAAIVAAPQVGGVRLRRVRWPKHLRSKARAGRGF